MHVLGQHIDIRVEVRGGDGAGAHEQVFFGMHHAVAGRLVCAGLDGGDGGVIGLSPGGVFHLQVHAVGGQVDGEHLQFAVLALAELGVIVAGAGNPHIQEGNGIVAVGQPAVAGHGVVAVLAGVQEGVPFLVGQVHGHADTGNHALQVFADQLVAFIGVVQVFNGREVGEGGVEKQEKYNFQS